MFFEVRGGIDKRQWIIPIAGAGYGSVGKWLGGGFW
jgi:hypothetical protein